MHRYQSIVFACLLWWKAYSQQTTTTTTWPLPQFTLKFIAIDEGLNLTETELYLESTLELHLLQSLQQQEDPWQLVELVLQTPYINRTFLGNESGIPVSLLRTDWSGVMEMKLTENTIDNELLAEANEVWHLYVYRALQGDALFDLLRLWGNHPVLQNIIAKVQVEDAAGSILDEADLADAFPPPGASPKNSMFNKQSIIMTVVLMVVLSLVMLLCWWYKKHRAKKEEERLRLERRAKWNKLKERRDRERAEKSQEEWMNEMTKSLTSISVRDTSKSTRQSSSLHRSSGDLLLQGSMDNLFAIPESEEQSQTTTSCARQQGTVLHMEEEEDDDDGEFVSHTVYL